MVPFLYQLFSKRPSETNYNPQKYGYFSMKVSFIILALYRQIYET